jgi:hypothetical protein
MKRKHNRYKLAKTSGIAILVLGTLVSTILPASSQTNQEQKSWTHPIEPGSRVLHNLGDGRVLDSQYEGGTVTRTVNPDGTETVEVDGTGKSTRQIIDESQAAREEMRRQELRTNGYDIPPTYEINFPKPQER